MLFRPVYGPELEAIYKFIKEQNDKGNQPDKHNLHQSFVPTKPNGSFCSTQNIDDAIIFLLSAKVIKEIEHKYVATESESFPFAVHLLKRLRLIETGKEEAFHPLDPLYLRLITELYIKPDRLYLSDLHSSANHLSAVKEVGGLSREKLRGWMRVMEFLGVGRRVQGQFVCIYHLELILCIFEQLSPKFGSLQEFFQQNFEIILPFERRDGDIAQPLAIPLLELEHRGQIHLRILQDSPTRPYFGSFHYRGFSIRGTSNA